MKDDLGDRMKDYYENRTRTFLPRRTFTVIRIDGKAFHTYTRGLVRPFDTELIDDMNATTKYLCENIQGAKFAYVQSDEISIVLTDFEKLTTDSWFDGNIQKIVSIAASMATSKFNQLRTQRKLASAWKNYAYGAGQDDPQMLNFDFTVDLQNVKMAHFDARVFTIPSQQEVVNYFIWRQQDAVRNSISAVAQSLYSAKELHGADVSVMQEMIFQKGQNWNNYPDGQKRGRAIVRRFTLQENTKQNYDRAKDKSGWTVIGEDYYVQRNGWVIQEPPTFSQQKDYINYDLITGSKIEMEA